MPPAAATEKPTIKVGESVTYIRLHQGPRVEPCEARVVKVHSDELLDLEIPMGKGKETLERVKRATKIATDNHGCFYLAPSEKAEPEK